MARSSVCLALIIHTSVITFKMTSSVFLIVFLAQTMLCEGGGSNIRAQRNNLMSGAGGYSSGNLDDNYDYILDDTPPRGKLPSQYLHLYYSNDDIRDNICNL